jgi:hypothetical protein
MALNESISLFIGLFKNDFKDNKIVLKKRMLEKLCVPRSAFRVPRFVFHVQRSAFRVVDRSFLLLEGLHFEYNLFEPEERSISIDIGIGLKIEELF